MGRGNALRVDLIRGGYQRFLKARQRATIAASDDAGCSREATPPAAVIQWYNSSAMAYGFRSGGSAGSSRISVMVTRRFAASEGSSGNSGWVSALPEKA